MGVFELGISSLHFLEVVCFLKENCLTNGFEGFFGAGQVPHGDSGPVARAPLRPPKLSSPNECGFLFSEGMRKESLHNGPAVGPGAYNNLDNSDQENEGKRRGSGRPRVSTRRKVRRRGTGTTETTERAGRSWTTVRSRERTSGTRVAWCGARVGVWVSVRGRVWIRGRCRVRWGNWFWILPWGQASACLPGRTLDRP